MHPGARFARPAILPARFAVRCRPGFILGLLLASVGCAREHGVLFPPTERPIEWPSPPDAPRVRFVGEIKGSADLHAGKSAGQAWNELLYGPTPPSAMAKPHAVAVSTDGRRVAVADTDLACVHVFDLVDRTYRRIENYGTARIERPVPQAPGGGNQAPPTDKATDPSSNREEAAGTEATGPAPRTADPTAGSTITGPLPTGVAWDGQTLWIADARLHAAVVVSPGGAVKLIGADRLKRPAGMAFCESLGRAYIVDAGAHAVVAFGRDGGELLRFGEQGAEPGQFNYPAQITCSPSGMLAVADAMNFRIQLFEADGAPVVAFGSKGDAPGDFALPKGVAFGPGGNLWVVDAHFENVQAFSPAGELLMVFGREGRAPGEFWLPAGICIDRERRMWIADTYNRRIQVFELLP